MKERIFIQKAKEHVQLEAFIRRQLGQAKCGLIEVQYTPVVTRIIVHTTTPGLIIGSGGERIKEMSELLKEKFKIENPQIDVQKISDPDLDSAIIAQSIASALETGVNYKRLGNYYAQKIMGAGAIGCEIVISGKLSGQRSRTERFVAGYLKKCGDPAEKDVQKAFALANPRLGNIGVTVKIMMHQPEHLRGQHAELAGTGPAEPESGAGGSHAVTPAVAETGSDAGGTVMTAPAPAADAPTPPAKKKAPRHKKTKAEPAATEGEIAADGAKTLDKS